MIVVNRNGREHLSACLGSLDALDYPRDRYSVLVVDNASTDGSRELVRAHVGAQLLELDHNVGFAPAVNLGAAAADTECVALINNDMRAEPGWLQGLVEAYRPADDVVCVGGVVLDWDGEHVDFAGGSANFHGFGDQPGHGRPVAEVDLAGARTEDALFASGGSLLIDRGLFLAVGGFDEHYFAYFEDVDLGWRLNVLGHRVAIAPASRCFHRHHGTSRRFAGYQRALLLERNALRSLLKNADDEHLARLLGPALLLLVARSLELSTSDRARYEPFAPRLGSERVPADALARLHAVGDVIRDLPDIVARRTAVQAARVRSDDEVFARFGDLLRPIGSTSAAYDHAFGDVLDLADLRQLFGDPAAPSRPTGDAGARVGERRGWMSRFVARSRAREPLGSLARRLRGG